MQKNAKKCKKIAKKFAHIKKKLYLCTVFQKGRTQNQLETKKNYKIMAQKQFIIDLFGNGTLFYSVCKSDFAPVSNASIANVFPTRKDALFVIANYCKEFENAKVIRWQ